MARSKEAERYLAANPYCEYHAMRGAQREANGGAHHLIFRSQGGRDIPTNFMSLCMDCHGHAHRDIEFRLTLIGLKMAQKFKKQVTRNK